MKSKDEISKGPKRRDETCYQVLHDIVIPAGTILRQEPGKPGIYSCGVNYGKFSIDAGGPLDLNYRKVIA